MFASHKNKLSFKNFFVTNRNISSEKSTFFTIPYALTSSQQCGFISSDHWHFTGRKTNCRRIGPEGVRIGGAMYGACDATGSCWRTARLEWYFEVTFSDWIIIVWILVRGLRICGHKADRSNLYAYFTLHQTKEWRFWHSMQNTIHKWPTFRFAFDRHSAKFHIVHCFNHQNARII